MDYLFFLKLFFFHSSASEIFFGKNYDDLYISEIKYFKIIYSIY